MDKYRFACPFVLIVNIGESVVVAGGHKHYKDNNNTSPWSGSSSALLDLPNQSSPPRSGIHRPCYTLKMYIYTIEYVMDGSDLSDTWMSYNNIWQENEWKSYMLLYIYVIDIIEYHSVGYWSFGVSNSQYLDCLFNSSVGSTTYETSKFCVTGPLWGESTVRRWFSIAKPIISDNAEGVSTSWRQHATHSHWWVCQKGISVTYNCIDNSSRLTCYYNIFNENLFCCAGDVSQISSPLYTKQPCLFPSQPGIQSIQQIFVGSRHFCKVVHICEHR